MQKLYIAQIESSTNPILHFYDSIFRSLFEAVSMDMYCTVLLELSQILAAASEFWKRALY